MILSDTELLLLISNITSIGIHDLPRELFNIIKDYSITNNVLSYDQSDKFNRTLYLNGKKIKQYLIEGKSDYGYDDIVSVYRNGVFYILDTQRGIITVDVSNNNKVKIRSQSNIREYIGVANNNIYYTKNTSTPSARGLYKYDTLSDKNEKINIKVDIERDRILVSDNGILVLRSAILGVVNYTMYNHESKQLWTKDFGQMDYNTTVYNGYIIIPPLIGDASIIDPDTGGDAGWIPRFTIHSTKNILPPYSVLATNTKGEGFMIMFGVKIIELPPGENKLNIHVIGGDEKYYYMLGDSGIYMFDGHQFTQFNEVTIDQSKKIIAMSRIKHEMKTPERL